MWLVDTGGAVPSRFNGTLMRRATPVVAALVSLVCASLAHAQEPVIGQIAAAPRDVNLRPDPSTTQPPIESLSVGDQVTIFDGPQSGYYHVRASDGSVGWVWQRNIRLPGSATPMNVTLPSGHGPKTTAHVNASACDATLWAHTYHPARLQLHDECVMVTGVMTDASHGTFVDGVRHESDGDTHGWITLDPEFAWMLDPFNATQEGNLVFEVVCHFKPKNTSTAAIQACGTFADTQQLPPVGRTSHHGSVRPRYQPRALE